SEILQCRHQAFEAQPLQSVLWARPKSAGCRAQFAARQSWIDSLDAVRQSALPRGPTRRPRTAEPRIRAEAVAGVPPEDAAVPPSRESASAKHDQPLRQWSTSPESDGRALD